MIDVKENVIHIMVMGRTDEVMKEWRIASDI